MFLAVNKTKTPPRASQLRITRALPWCFPPIIQSCLPPRLRPPIDNSSTVKLPLSIQWTRAAQCRLPGGISSLLAPSPPPCYLLVSCCLSLYVLAIICQVMGMSYNLPPHKDTGQNRLSPLLQKCRQRQRRQQQCRRRRRRRQCRQQCRQRQHDADNDNNAAADNTALTQTTDDNADNNAATPTMDNNAAMPMMDDDTDDRRQSRQQCCHPDNG
jgi:hypothetical protein